MMSLLLSKGSDSVYELERADEIREVVTLRNMVLINDSPSTHLLRETGQFFAFEGRDSAFAWHTRSLGKIGHFSAI